MMAQNGYRLNQQNPTSASATARGGGGSGGYHYDSYDTSDYGSPPSSRPGSDNWRPPQAVMNGISSGGRGGGGGGGGYEGFDFGTNGTQIHSQQPSPQQISINTLQNSNSSNHINAVVHTERDQMARHLLYENALLDSARYEILDLNEVDALKKERARLESRVQAAQHKLVLESKVKDAAHNLHKLYARKQARPDTPQRNDSRGSTRSSIFGGMDKKNTNGNHRASGGTENLVLAQEELADSLKKVDALNENIRELLGRQAEVDRKLISHTAAVLAEEANNKAENAVVGATNGHHSMYVADEFDSLRDILRGAPPESIGKAKAYEEQFSQVQGRLEQLNSELREVIDEANHMLGQNPAAESSLNNSGDPAEQLENRFVRLEYTLDTLKQQQQDVRARLQDSEQHGQSAEDAQKLVDYEDTVAGLWDILQAENDSSGDGDNSNTPYQESFSLNGFSTRVQHLYHRAQSAKEQQDILRRQIQQQRELNGQSDAEKDRNIEELRATHGQLTAERDQVQEELAKYMVQHQQAEEEATHLKLEHTNIMNEIDELRRTVDIRQQERDEISRSLESHQNHSQTLQDHISSLEAQVNELTTTGTQADSRHVELTTAKDAAEARVAEVQQDMENLESEVVRLTTELTMAKADLDVAHGSRAERAGAQAAEVESLSETNKKMVDELNSLRAEAEGLRRSAKATEHAAHLERELQDMTNEFQAMTKESIELEKEREQLDSLIDSLRERVETLEGQLSDEKVRWMGMKAPNNGGNGVSEMQSRESTSMTVLRQEFKKMVRETRAEGVRLIRAEQEERRRLEAEVRKLRQANGPMGKVQAPPALSGGSSSATASAPMALST